MTRGPTSDPVPQDRLVHSEPGPGPALATLAFLIGELGGEGWFGDPHTRVTKTVSGAWAAGGRHIKLDMTTDHVLADGRVDRHSALVVVSEIGDALAARAYTDAGGSLDYPIEQVENGIRFVDRVPHGSGATRARKLLLPTPIGYDEILEVDSPGGASMRYSVITLERR